MALNFTNLMYQITIQLVYTFIIIFIKGLHFNIYFSSSNLTRSIFCYLNFIDSMSESLIKIIQISLISPHIDCTNFHNILYRRYFKIYFILIQNYQLFHLEGFFYSLRSYLHKIYLKLIYSKMIKNL